MTESKSTPASRRKGKDSDTRTVDAIYHWTEHGFTPLASKPVTITATESTQAWERAIGIHLADTGSVIKRIKEGLNISAFERLTRSLDIPAARLAEVTGIAARTLDRRKKEGRLLPAESERVLRLAMLFDKAVTVLGDIDHARRWFKTPVQALGGGTPLEYADTEIGAREVEDLLGRLEHGVFS